MRKRHLVIGGLLTVVITTAVIIYASGCHSAKEDGCPEDWIVPGMNHVLVATQDIHPGQAMDTLIRSGGIMEIMVPLDALGDGTARDVSQIEGRTATEPIGKDEQIPLEDLSHKQGPTVFAERDSFLFLKGARPILESYMRRDVSAKEWLSQTEKELPKLQRLIDRNRDPISWRLAGDLSSAFGLLQRALTDRVSEREERACEAMMEAHLRLTNYGNRVSIGGAADLVPDPCHSAKVG